MRAKNKQPDRFDLMAGELLRSAALSHDEIESIAEDDNLFSSVRARIIADGVARNASVSSFSSFQRTAIVTVAGAVIVVAVFGAMMFARRPQNRTVAGTTAAQPLVSEPKQFDRNRQPAPVRQDVDVTPGESRQPHIERAMDYRPVSTERRSSPRPQPQLREQPPEFFAVAGLRPSAETVDGGRVIRVELPRASLVALGVNVPLDSDKQLIKTDLLVGPDGVPRAIRLVE